MRQSGLKTDSDASVVAKTLLGSSERRQALTFFPPATGTAYICTEGTPSAANGIALVAGSAPIYLDVDYHGYAVCMEWKIAYAAASSAISFLEITA